MTHVLSQRTVAIATIFALLFSLAPFNPVALVNASHDAVEPDIQIDTVNGQDAQTEFVCPENPLFNPIDIEGSGQGTTPPGSIEQYGVQVDWGDGSDPEDANYSSTPEEGGPHENFTFEFDASHEYAESDTYTIVVLLYHQLGQGNEPTQVGEPFSITICVDVDPPTPATLTLEKEVVNDDEGAASDTDWTLEANGPTPISGAEGDAAVTDAEVDPGTYDLSETDGPDGYVASDWVCVGGTQDDADTVTVSEGDSVTCTITNDDEEVIEPGTGKIIVIKDAVPNHAKDFVFTLSGNGEPTQFSLDDDSNATLSNTEEFDLAPGEYAVVENNYPKYVQSVSCESNQEDEETADSIDLQEGEIVTCTFTNELFGSIKICKAIVDEEGDFITGDSLGETEFSIDLTDGAFDGPLVEAVQFVTALTLNSNQFSDNENANDAECVTIEDLPITQDGYYYSEEDIESDEDWDIPLYHDRFEGPYKNSPLPLSEMGEYFVTVEESDDDNRDGHILLTAQRPNRILVILNRLLDDTNEPTPEICDNDIDDDQDTLVDENDPDCQQQPTEEICDDGIDNDLDGFVDENDSDCDDGGGGDDPECSDGVDNSDEEDELADEDDPGCHTDGDSDNTESYDPNDDDETDGGTGGGPTDEICDDGIDNDLDGEVDNDDSDCDDNGGGGGGSSTGGSVVIASCVAIPSSTTTGATVTFSASAINLSAGPVVYVWGGAAAGGITQAVNRSFGAPGTYVATVTVIDSDGRDDDATCDVDVTGGFVPPLTGLPGGAGGAGGAGGVGGAIAQETDEGDDSNIGTTTFEEIVEEEEGPGFLASILDLLNGGIVLWIIIILLILLILWWLFGRRKDDEDKGKVNPR